MRKLYSISALSIVLIMIMVFMRSNKIIYIDLPTIDPEAISVTRFNDWIGGVTPVVNVFVKPANSPVFAGDNEDIGNFDRVDFFRWSQQMFLWILSPVPTDGSYGSCNGLVLNSPEFYDFIRDEQTGIETYVRHTCNSSSSKMSFDVKGAQNGINNLPLFFEKGTDNVYDIDATPLSINGYPLVYDGNKNKVEIGKIETINSTPIFYDIKGKVIDKVNLILNKSLNPKTTIQQIHIIDQVFPVLMVNEFTPVVLIPAQDQASLNGDTANVLMSRNHSLVYYNIMVNDVYVVFSKMINDGVIPEGSLFPTTLDDEDSDDPNIPKVGLNTIKNYASSHGIPIIDTDNRVLAMELKTSWVETVNLPNSDNYVKIKATIPNYEQSSPGAWTRNGTKTAELALVGMHVVGSVAGHPEMIWSTFEHINNAPNPQIDAITHPQSNGFLFFDNTQPLPTPNVPHISGVYNLSGANGFDISPSNTVRNQPFGWGGIPGVAGGNGALNVADIAANSTSDGQLTAMYSDTRSRLLPGDVRRNYFQVGAMWNSVLHISNPDNHEAGTIRLSNATMETYTQATSSSTIINTGAGLNCFSCHNRGVNNSTGVFEGPPPPKLKPLSHVFGRQISP
jgi:hypothetical protein